MRRGRRYGWDILLSEITYSFQNRGLNNIFNIVLNSRVKLNWVLLSAIHTSLGAIAGDTRNKILLYRTITSKRAVSRDQDGKTYENASAWSFANRPPGCVGAAVSIDSMLLFLCCNIDSLVEIKLFYISNLINMEYLRAIQVDCKLINISLYVVQCFDVKLFYTSISSLE